MIYGGAIEMFIFFKLLPRKRFDGRIFFNQAHRYTFRSCGFQDADDENKIVGPPSSIVSVRLSQPVVHENYHTRN